MDVSALNGIAIAYDLIGDDHKALNYYQQSIVQLDKLALFVESIKNKLEIAKVYYNTAKFYSKINEYTKAIDLCTLGIELLQNENLTYFLDFLLYEKGFNLMKIKHTQEAETYYLYALVLADIQKNQRVVELIRNDVELYNIQNIDISKQL